MAELDFRSRIHNWSNHILKFQILDIGDIFGIRKKKWMRSGCPNFANSIYTTRWFDLVFFGVNPTLIRLEFEGGAREPRTRQQRLATLFPFHLLPSSPSSSISLRLTLSFPALALRTRQIFVNYPVEGRGTPGRVFFGQAERSQLLGALKGPLK